MKNHVLAMGRWIGMGWVAAYGVMGGVRAGVAAPVAEVQLAAEQRALLERYCVGCHGAEKQKGKVRLDDLPFQIRDIPTAERWQKVLNVLNSGEMPPEEEKQPAGAEKAAFLEKLSETMVLARRMLSDSGGAVTMRRLNKREYENAMEALLGVRVEAKDLPKDGGGGAFDTVGKSLFFSSDQWEQYLALARRALDRAIAAGPRPETKRVRIEAETEANFRITWILRGYQMGGYRANKQWKASHGRPTTDFGIVDEGEMKFRMTVWERNTAPMIDYLTRPETKTGALLTIGEPNGQVGMVIPDEMPAGKYRIRARVAALPGADPARTFLEIGVRGKSLTDAMALVDCRKVNAPMSDPEVIETEVEVAPVAIPLKEEIGPETKKRIWLGERVYAVRERQHNSAQASSYRHSKALDETGFGDEPALWVDWMEWEGPVVEQWPPLGHARIFFKGEGAVEDEGYAREILERFAERAFRGKPVRGSYVDKLMGHYRDQRAQGEGFAQALKEPLSIILASPSFLYLSEPGEDIAGRKALSGRELADRLAFFLWSAPPDEELSALGKSGELLQPNVLAAQTDRLLDSPKSRQWVRGFAHQWLHLERLDFFQFNYRLFPEFDDSVKRAAREEVFQTLETVLRERLSLGALLKSDFVVINDLLAQFYGIPGVKGPEFRKVSVPGGMPRGGFLGMAAVLAMGSDGERSSPVERGAWVLRKLLHAPPPPAPANVPQLSRHAGKLLPARELLKAHMEEAQCYQCHRKIDPIGFGLEHFNAVGLWREREYTEIAGGNRASKSKEHEIDSQGTLPDGTVFGDFFELRKAVAAREEAFVRGFSEHLIAYALGRPFGFSDEELVLGLVAQAKAKGYEGRAVIQGLVASKAFRSK